MANVDVDTNADVDATNTIEVDVYIPQYTIVGDDIYIQNYTTNPPAWFNDFINHQIDNSKLANAFGNLNTEFSNFKDGYTNQIAYLKTSDTALAASVETLKVSNDTNTAGIQRLDVVKITASDATAISQATIGAWASGEGGAWFQEKVSAVSNVAYSAAKSSSTLTATMNSQQSQLNAIVGDISTLQKQIDGKIETWFSVDNPVNSDKTINVNVEPYKTWLANGTVPEHTGDTYIYYELKADGVTKHLLATFRFGTDSNAEVYNWFIFKDDLASVAYEAALNAQETADGKIVTYYQSYPPEASKSVYGDLWLDSDDGNKMYRYNGTAWMPVDDNRITASVQRLDEATVTVDGKATAKSSLIVSAGNSVSGFVIGADNKSSSFKILADKFVIAANDGSEVGSPFVVNTATNKIRFTGQVSFAGTEVENSLKVGEAANDINRSTTTIDGGKITTGSITANQIAANSITATSLKADALYGKKIVGGYIEGSQIVGSVIKASWIDYTSNGVLTNWQYFSPSNPPPSQYLSNFAKDSATGALIVDSDGYYRLPSLQPVYSTPFSAALLELFNGNYPTYQNAVVHIPNHAGIYSAESYTQSNTNRIVKLPGSQAFLSVPSTALIAQSWFDDASFNMFARVQFTLNGTTYSLGSTPDDKTMFSSNDGLSIRFLGVGTHNISWKGIQFELGVTKLHTFNTGDEFLEYVVYEMNLYLKSMNHQIILTTDEKMLHGYNVSVQFLSQLSIQGLIAYRKMHMTVAVPLFEII